MFQTRVVEEIKTHCMFNNILPPIVPFMRYVGKHGTDKQTKDDNIILRMGFACWISKAADSHTECVKLTAFLRQQWLYNRVSILRYTYIACLVRPTLCMVQ